MTTKYQILQTVYEDEEGPYEGSIYGILRDSGYENHLIVQWADFENIPSTDLNYWEFNVMPAQPENFSYFVEQAYKQNTKVEIPGYPRNMNHDPQYKTESRPVS